jgi:hypothetical protein
MMIIRCVEQIDSASSTMSSAWTMVFALVSLYWFGLFLYGVIPAIKYAAGLPSFPGFTHFTRVICTFLFALKSLYSFICIAFGRYYRAHISAGTSVARCNGLLEVPRAFASTCFTVILSSSLFCLVDSFPRRYGWIEWVFNPILIAYNLIIWIISAVSIAKSDGDVALYREAALLMVLSTFIVFLWIAVRAEAPTREMTRHEKLLFSFTIALIVSRFVIVAGYLAQAGLLPWVFDECTAGMMFIYATMEIGCDGLPLLCYYLMHLNNELRAEGMRLLDSLKYERVDPL